MDIKRRVKIILGIFTVLTLVNLTAVVFAMRANNERAYAYEEKYALSSAVSDMSRATTAMTRLTRAAVVTGCESLRDAFLAEYERDITGQAAAVFLDFDTPDNERYILEAYIEGRALMHALFEEALALRAAGYWQEAIDLAHSPALSDVGTAVGRMSSELRALAYSRTQSTIDNARIRAAVLGRVVSVTGALLTLAGVYALLFVGRKKTSRLVRCIAALFVVLMGLCIFLALSAGSLRQERNSSHRLRLTLTYAVDEVELSSESLKRLSRLYVVTNNAVQRDLYWQELRRDRFLHAVDDFIIHGASDNEVNALVGLVYSFTLLRQIEEDAIHLRTAGYARQATELIFGAEADASFAPIGVLACALRAMVSERTEEALTEAERRYRTRFTLLLAGTLLFMAVGFAGLVVKLRQAGRDTGYAVNESYPVRRLKNTTIAVRIAASFTLIIVIFVGFIILTNNYNNSMTMLNNHKVHYLLARIELVTRYHQEFTEMRRLVRESFMNAYWRSNTNEVVWRSFERRFSESHVRLTDMAMAYKDNVRADPILPETPNDSRIYIMREIQAHVDMIYDIFSENFFLDGGGELRFDHGNVLDYSGATEMLMQTLIQIGRANRVITVSYIDYYRRTADIVTGIALSLVLFLTTAVTYFLVKHFNLRVKALRVYAGLVSEGNFETALENISTDEISDIFAQMVNERAAKVAEEERIKLMLDATPMSMCLYDKDMNPIACNAEVVAMFGIDAKETYLTSGSYFMPETQPDGTNSVALFESYFAKTLSEGRVQAEYLGEKADGTLMSVETTFVRLDYKGDYIIAEYVRDLTDLKKAERAEEESRAKTRFLAYMSHEIRTPMNVVMGIANIQIKKGGHAPEIEEAFSRIYASSKTLLTIINDILDLSKAEAGKMQITPGRYSVAGLISATVQSHFMPIDNKGIGFKLDIDENLPRFLIGDELRIKQILNNILSNAYKYTPKGEISLSFGVEPGGAPDTVVLVLRVGDTGQGMTEEQLATLFDAFVRFDTDEINHAVEGIGLGTTIAHQLAGMMQGTIDVASEPGKGSVFTVRIPQKMPPGSDANTVLGKTMAENALNPATLMHRDIPMISYRNMSHARVLVVDDVETNLYVVEGLLMPYEIKAETALNGKEAVDKIKSGAVYDIIFMDYMMPVMDGMEAMKIIRQTGYDRPIVALTANALKGAEEMFMDSGFSGFLSKPIDTNRFDEYLVRFIE